MLMSDAWREKQSLSYFKRLTDGQLCTLAIYFQDVEGKVRERIRATLDHRSNKQELTFEAALAEYILRQDGEKKSYHVDFLCKNVTGVFSIERVFAYVELDREQELALLRKLYELAMKQIFFRNYYRMVFLEKSKGYPEFEEERNHCMNEQAGIIRPHKHPIIGKEVK